MVALELLEVFYAPHRAFRKIVQNPKFLGPLLIVVIFVAFQVGYFYVYGSKSNLEQTMPTFQRGDAWTENAALWQASSGVIITNNHVDYINSSNRYYNTTSIEFTTSNASSIQIFLSDFGESVNCGPNGFKNLSVRVKAVSSASIPNNVTLYLYSLSPANYFAYDLTSAFSNTTVAEQHYWNNISVLVGTNDWTSSNSAATWENITGLRMDFEWASSSSIDLRVDGLFFRGIYKGLLETDSTGFLINSGLNSVTPFLFQWLLLTALMFLLIKGLKGNVVWKPLMVAVGVALTTLIVQSIIILAVNVAIRPNINYPLEILAGIPGEAETTGVQIIQSNPALGQVFQVQNWVPIAVWVWIFVLDVFIVRAVTAVAPVQPADVTQAKDEGMVGYQQFGWTKSMMVSAVSLVLMIFILGFLGLGIIYG